MKTTIIACLAVMFAITLRAQDRDQIRLQDHLMLQDGIVVQVHDQDQIRLRDRITLWDGTIVNLDGTYTDDQGVQRRLLAGECLDMDGNWYMSQTQFRQQLQLRTQASEQLHYVMQDGSVIRVQQQARVQLREQARLADGGYVNPDGSFKLRNQEQMRLRTGECLDPEGNYFGSESQFRKNEQLRLQVMSQEHFVYANGKMIRTRNQERSELQQEVTLPDGTIVYPDGAIQLRERDRTRDRIHLQDGECVDTEGKIYRSQTQFRDQAQIRLMAMNQEHFLLENGKLFQVRDQQRVQVREQLMIHAGLIVNPDGTCQLQNRQQLRLNNGECLDMEGNRYRTQAQFRTQAQQRLQAMAEPHFFYQNGAVYRNQNQMQSQIRETWKLQDGTVVNPDGTLQLNNGTKSKMRNGEFLDWEGKRYENRDRFRERMESRVRDRMEMRDRELLERKRANEAGKRIGM